MLVSNWPAAFAHVDADCFFASCELVRRPELRGQPLCVLSSQDACVVAKTYDAKAAGIATGMTAWEAKRLLPHAVFLSADFRYYGLLSDKLFSILRRYSPVVEEYSIDEGFLDLHGLRSLHGKPFQAIADEMRGVVWQELGITVSVGVSVTRTLAKMASEYNKPDGTTIVAGKRIHDFLQQRTVRDIPGIGRNREALLDKFAIRTAADFVDKPEREIKRLLGRAGTDLWHELQGMSIHKLETGIRLPKSVSRTASLGRVTRDMDIIHHHLAQHAMRLSAELMFKRLTARQLTVFITLKSFEQRSTTVTLPYPSADYFLLVHEAFKVLPDLVAVQQDYRGCGLIATDIAGREEMNFDLFQQIEQQHETRHLQLMQVIHHVNHKYGSKVLRMGTILMQPYTATQVKFKYPLFECR